MRKDKGNRVGVTEENTKEACAYGENVFECPRELYASNIGRNADFKGWGGEEALRRER